jgi:hypothetical protein
MAGAYQPGDQERADVPTPADDHDPHDERLRPGDAEDAAPSVINNRRSRGRGGSLRPLAGHILLTAESDGATLTDD